MDVRVFLFALVGVLVQTLVTADCRNGWVQNEQSCYFLHPELLNWELAKVMCDSVGGHLAVIETAEENIFLTGLLQTRHVNKAWIGLDDIVVEGTFVWITNQEVPEYTNWYPGNPSNSNGSEDCGELGDNGLWNDVSCEGATRSALCETTAAESSVVG